jgi:hypothetical protein
MMRRLLIANTVLACVTLSGLGSASALPTLGETPLVAKATNAEDVVYYRPYYRPYYHHRHHSPHYYRRHLYRPYYHRMY